MTRGTQSSVHNTLLGFLWVVLLNRYPKREAW